MRPLSAAVKEPASQHWLLLIIGAGLLLRLMYFQENVDNPFFYAPSLDEAYYIAHGKYLAETSWLGSTYTFYMDPLYSYFLGLCYSAHFNNTLVRLLQIAFDTAAIYVIYQISLQLWRQRAAALIAGAIYACYLPAIFYAPILLKTTLNNFALLLWVLFVLQTINKKQPIAWLGCGALGGLLCYLQGNNVLTITASIAALWLILDGSCRKLHIAQYITGFAMIVSIGMFRNHIVENEWRPFSNSFGYVFYIANHPGNTYHDHTPPSFVTSNRPSDIDREFRQEVERREGHAFSTSEASHYWAHQTVQLLQQHTDLLVKNIVEKTQLFISAYEMPNNYSITLAKKDSAILRLPLFSWPLVFAIGLCGLILAGTQQKKTALLWAPIIAVLATCIIFFPASRFRFPAASFFIIGSGYATSYILDNLRNNRHRRSIILLLTANLIFCYSLYASVPQASLDTLRYNKAVAFLRINQPENAKAIVDLLLTASPDNIQYQITYANTLLQMEKPDQTLRITQAILQQQPQNISAMRLNGLALLELGQTENAVAILRNAVRAGAEGSTHVDLARALEAHGDANNALEEYRIALQDGTLLEDSARYAIAKQRAVALSNPQNKQ